MTGLSLKRPHVLYRSILFYLSIIGFVSISYGGIAIQTEVTDLYSNGSISNVTGYFNTTNGIRITVTLTDDADGNHLTQFGNGKFSVWGCFTPGNQTPATDHGEFSDLNEADDFLDGVATLELSRNDITGNHSGTDNDVWDELTGNRINDDTWNDWCGTFCQSGHPKFDLWVLLFENNITNDGVFRDITFPDADGVLNQPNLIYDIWGPRFWICLLYTSDAADE